MPHLKLRLRFNPGREGTPLDKLGDFATQAEKFLRSFAADLGVTVQKGEWLAKDFRNESTSWDTLYVETVDEKVIRDGVRVIDALTGPDPYAASSAGTFSYSTLLEFSKIGKGMDPDEVYYIGAYEHDADQEPLWREVSYRKVAEIRKFLETPQIIYGAVQGVLHAWFPGASPPFMHLRPLDDGELVKCICTPEQYGSVHEATKVPNTVLMVYGDVAWDRGTQTIQSVQVKDIEDSNQISPDQFDSLFGSMPGATGKLTTSEYIDLMRGREDSND